MKHDFEKLTIIKVRKSSEQNLNSDLQWFSNSLGLFGERDKEKSCFRVFVELVKAARKRKPMSSDEIALKSNLSRATVIHHLNKLIESGLITIENNCYILRENNLEDLVEEIKKDTLRIFQDLQLMAEEIDEELGFPYKKKNQTIVD